VKTDPGAVGPPAAPAPSAAEAAAPPAPSAAAPPVALYVHVPFCVSLCPYCDFVVYSGSASRGPRARVAAFLVALRTELGLRADALDARWGPPDPARRPPLESVYLGGGTPSLLPAAEVAALLELVRARFGLQDDAEVTLEANPGAGERGDLAGFAAAGVNRISFGAQSLHAGELRRLGRRHRPPDVGDAVAAAREAGIGSLNLDLLYDVPGQSPASWSATLDGAVAIGPEHLSLYALTLDDPDAEGLTGPGGDHLPTTAGARRWRIEARRGQDEDRAAEAYAAAVVRLAAAGYAGYEISNWARPGQESRHNLVYWTRRPHEAVGPGAHAFDGAARSWNAARLDGYLGALAPADGSTARLPPGGSERLDDRSGVIEAIVLGLRLARGVPASWADHAPLESVAPWALETGLLERVADRLQLTLRGRLLSNELFARLV
jgi:putative oxygen-independent coproporphyrinogen III oxidase